jgi:hypothetical protein
MKTDNLDAVVNFDLFDLDFVSDEKSSNSVATGADEEEEEFSYDGDKVLDEMQAEIPQNAKAIGLLEDEVENFTTWQIRIHFYVIPWTSP